MGITATTEFTGPHTLRPLQNGAECQGHPCLYSVAPQNKGVDLRRPSPALPRHEKRGVASGLGEAGLVQAEASPGLRCIHGLLLGSGVSLRERGSRLSWSVLGFGSCRVSQATERRATKHGPPSGPTRSPHLGYNVACMC